MAIDFEALRSKMKQIESQDARKQIYTLKDGINKVRILPLSNKLFFYEAQIYYIDKSKPKLFNEIAFSPATFGEPDPIKEFARELRQSGNIELASKLSPSTRYFSAVLVRGKESEGIKYWGYGKMVLNDISQLFLNEEWGDISHPLNGTDLNITFKKAANPRDSVTTIQPARSSTPLIPNASNKEIAELLKKIPPFESLYYRPSVDECRAALEAFLKSQDEPDASKNDEAYDTSHLDNEEGMKHSGPLNGSVSEEKQASRQQFSTITNRPQPTVAKSQTNTSNKSNDANSQQFDEFDELFAN